MTDPAAIGDLLSAGALGPSIRPWRVTDGPALFAAWSDPEVARWNGVPPTPSLGVAERWLRGAARQTSASPSVDVVAVDADDRVQGEVGFVIDPERRMAEVGFFGVVVYTRVQTPRFCGQACKCMDFWRFTLGCRGLRISC